jgi:hypothetical protein
VKNERFWTIWRMERKCRRNDLIVGKMRIGGISKGSLILESSLNENNQIAEIRIAGSSTHHEIISSKK